MTTIGDVSGTNAMAAIMAQLKGADVQSVIGLAVMRKMQDQQKLVGQQLASMIDESAIAPGGIGQRVDIRV
jgi:hypothetical protein